MSAHAHLPVLLSEKNSRDPLSVQDWPGASLVPAGHFKSELVWVPFDLPGKRPLVDKAIYPRLAQLKIGASVDRSKYIVAEPPDDKGKIIQAPADEAVVHVPFWLLSTMDKTRGWAGVDAYHGVLVAGDVAATPAQARIRLVVLLALALMGIAIVSLLLSSLVSYVFYDLLELNPIMAIVPGTLLLGSVVWWIRSMLLPLFGEPLERVISSRLRLPLDRRWLRLELLFGIVSIVFCLNLIPWLYKMGVFLSTDYYLPHQKAPINTKFIIGLIFFSTALVMAVTSLAASRGKWLNNSMLAVSRDFHHTEKSKEVLVANSVINVALMVMAGLSFGLMLMHFAKAIGEYHSGLSSFFLIHGAQIGALLGLHLGRFPKGARLVLSVGLLVDGLVSSFMGPWAVSGLVFLSVAMVDLPRNFRKYRSVSLAALWDSSRAAWGFTIGATMGRILGGWFGFLMFPLFNVGGVTAGTVLGTFIGATVGYISQRSGSPSAPSLLAGLERS